MGLPFGAFVFGGSLLLYCKKDLRNYKTGIITIKSSRYNK